MCVEKLFLFYSDMHRSIIITIHNEDDELLTIGVDYPVVYNRLSVEYLTTNTNYNYTSLQRVMLRFLH